MKTRVPFILVVFALSSLSSAFALTRVYTWGDCQRTENGQVQRFLIEKPKSIFVDWTLSTIIYQSSCNLETGCASLVKSEDILPPRISKDDLIKINPRIYEVSESFTYISIEARPSEDGFYRGSVRVVKSDGTILSKKDDLQCMFNTSVEY